MGLSASMWTSVSGLLAHGNKMNVVGNNIANVSTIGFKSQRMDFNDYLYINSGSTSGTVQVGAGVNTYAIIGDFSQGSLESTNSVTDIAIDGEGFFKVRQPNSDQTYYTRAGDFFFNASRQLQNPEGYFLQGWKVDNSTRLTFKNDSVNLGEDSSNESAFVGTGTPVDIVLDSWYLEPQRTSSISFTMGLTSKNDADRSTSATNPMTALFDQWDATKNPPMADSSYATSSSIKVYDEGGTAHTLTVYYDQVSTTSSNYEIQGLPAGYTMYEYVVTIPPEEDMRSYGGKGYDPETNTWETEPTNFYNADPDVCNKNAGMLMTGHLIFDASGNLVNQSAYTYGGSDTSMNDGDQYSGDPAALASWQSTRFSSNGLPVFCANFTGQPLANTVNELDKNGKSQAQDYIIELDLGLRNLGGTESDWSVQGKSLADLTPSEIPTTTTVYNRVSPTGTVYATDANAYLVDKDGKPIEDATGNKLTAADIFANPGDPYSALTPVAQGHISAGAKVVVPVTAYKENTDGYKFVAGQGVLDKDGNPADPADLGDYYILNNDGDYVPLVNNGAIDEATLATATNIKIYVEDPDAYKAVETKSTYPAGLTGLIYKDNGADIPVTVNADGTVNLPDGITQLYQKNEVPGTKQVINYNDQMATFASAQRGENASSAGTSSFVTQDAAQNGYPSGVLSGTNITTDGVVYGYYDNGETVPLYQIALYDFHNKQGLRREGGNLYAQTKESGEARQGVAGDNGFGVTRAYNIESSNVDLSREFVNMITTQRGFQANSKGITTVDTMLETVIGMKR